MKDSYYEKVALQQHGIYLFVGFDVQGQKPFWSMGLDTADSEMKIRVTTKDARQKLEELRKLVDDAIAFIDVQDQKTNDETEKINDESKN